MSQMAGKESDTAFEEVLLQALKLLDQPEKLGATSLLAAPYFLSRASQPGMNLATAQMRGHLLQTIIKKAAQQLWGEALPSSKTAMQAALKEVRKERGTPRYSYLVLELRYFQDYFQPRSLRDIYEDDAYLIDSKTGDHRSHKIALQHLGAALLGLLRPALRLEQPPQPTLFVGYVQEQQKLATLLQSSQTVFLSGPTGVGKTTLAAATAKVMRERPIFWYTFHPLLNDHLGSLLFGLGHFLHEQAPSQLWQYLLANQGALTNVPVATALLREDLAAFPQGLPLLCFDELDLLWHSDPAQIVPAHRQLLAFIESLRGLTPILLIGQRAIVESDQYLTLNGFKSVQIPELWQAGGCTLHYLAVEKLYAATQGNLRLLRLCLTLTQDGMALDEIIAHLTTEVGLFPIFQRLWRRLDEQERHLLQQLAVFRQPAPDHLWPATVLASLSKRHLVENDGQGHLIIAAGLQALIYPELDATTRQTLHQQAAHLLLPYAEYTEVAYHFWQGGQPDQAIQVWYPQRQQEIGRGQTDAALAIFESIDRQQVGAQEQRGLDLLRAELRNMRGELTKGLADLAAITWADASEMGGRLLALRSAYQDALGYPDRAIRSYGDGLQLLMRLQAQVSRFHYRLSRAHLRQMELAAAKREARLAECQLCNLFGEIEESEGRYQEALLSYQKALVLAQMLDDAASLAQTYRNLGALLGSRLQKADEAVAYMQKAMRYYEQLGDRHSLETTRSNLSAIYLQTGQFAAALATATKAYRFFQAINAPYQAAVEAVNLAEAYFELGQPMEAETYARQALDLEERLTYPYALFTLGRIEGQRGNHHSAQSHLHQAIRTAELNEDFYMKAYAERELGKAFLAAGNQNEAQQALTTAQQTFQQLSMTQEVQETEKLLALSELTTNSATKR